MSAKDYFGIQNQKEELFKEAIAAFKENGGEERMIASRTEGERSLVRIHDEYCEDEPDVWLPRLSKIVTDAYRRRAAEGR